MYEASLFFSRIGWLSIHLEFRKEKKKDKRYDISTDLK
jgi:hypothetical protein